MNIKVTRSSYKNKEGKWAVIFDCSEKNYRKKVKTSLYLEKDSFTKGGINIIESYPGALSLKIILEKINYKREEALLKYEINNWSYDDLEAFLRKGINFYSLEEYVKEILSKSKNSITAKDYLNVVLVFKKHLSKINIHFKDILKEKTIQSFKFNAEKNGLKSSSINSYLKKMGVIMNHAYKDGFISERFVLPKFAVEKIDSNSEVINFSKQELIGSINDCTDIYQIQSISIFSFLLACGGMNPSNLMNYEVISNKKGFSLINSILLDSKFHYLKFKKSKKGMTHRFIKINFRIKKLIEIMKILFHISHYKKYPFILETYSNQKKVFNFNIYEQANLYKNLWNFYQKKLREISKIKFSNAKSIYYQFLDEIEMNKTISEIMYGDIKDEDALKIRDISGLKEKIEKAENDVLNKIGIDEITQILINKLKFLDLDLNDVSFMDCKTPLEFSHLMKRLNRYHKGL